MSRPDPIAAATAIQRAAARPDRSAAVRASAGAGKTRVLVDRFVRLCTEGEHDGVHPRAILAITFTRKAATEIRGRLLERARALALAGDDDRRAKLADLFAGDGGPRQPTPAEEDRAARLYERLLEDPAGLQVGTIHSFCQRILQRFATEAGLDPHARLIEDREDLLDEALDRLVAEAAADPRLAVLVQDLGGTPASVRVCLRPVFREQMRLDRWLRRAAAAAGAPARPRAPLVPALLAELRGVLFGDAPLGDEVRQQDLVPALAAALDRFAGAGLDGVEAALGAADLGKQGKNVQALRDAAAAADHGDPAALREVLLTKAGKVRAFSRVKDPELKEHFQQLVLAAAVPVLAALRRLDLVGLYCRNRAILELGLRVLDLLDELKRRDRVLDFGDLEDLACVLMGDQARALSLLFRLEDSLRHVLVDEFQDTNFNQRDILLPLVEEFLGGGAGEDSARPTVFFVGDLKQSIYGFRGAEPGIFAGMSAHLVRFEQDVHTLPTNFRSLPAVVDGVGRLFRVEPLGSRLPAGEADHVQQLAFRVGEGQVAVLAAYEDDADGGLSGHQHAAAAAARLARSLHDQDGYAWADILVLYRSRTGVSLYEQAFRAAGIPFEPAGRGMLAASREVQDVLALLRWLVWPEDDVALAAVLRSPIVRLSEDAFQRLLAARGLFRQGPDGRALPPAGLWTTLRAEAAADPLLAEAAARLQAWRADTGFVGCHELLRRIGREGDLTERYAAALGPQARRNLERLYDLALAPELAGTPTVRRFIDLVDKAGRRGGHEEGTSAAGGDGGRVRFLTIHGAKGLEAPVVLLVDADRALDDRTTEVRLAPAADATGLVFGARKDARLGIEGAEEALPPDALQQAGAAAARAAEVEETNLLYVAMT
ncbi:MAG: UvrD-helicase domain-containing protein, partial [Candidatus Krumholzibacteriia bacterium]